MPVDDLSVGSKMHDELESVETTLGWDEILWSVHVVVMFTFIAIMTPVVSAKPANISSLYNFLTPLCHCKHLIPK